MIPWREGSRAAEHWKPLDGAGRVVCGLCPRHCTPRPGQDGFCRVRGNVGGALHTFNYGRSVAATEEVIETEGVFHYSPGARILSLGNVGCMMTCSFCQNWQTSQVRHLDPDVVRTYSPEQIVEMCEEHGIGVISWTYNDPVVWHEFVRDTSRLAQARGIRTLYKSAFYIEEEPVRELIDCIDIFSLSLKSLNPAWYRQATGGELAPMLERTIQVHRSGRHLEVSNLVIPQANDSSEEIRKTYRWVLDTLGDRVPLHFVGFHPAYRYTHVGRTPVEILLQAREEARAEGVRYCYLGNVYRDGVTDTHCPACGHRWVRRFGLSTSVEGLRPDGGCVGCGASAPIRRPFDGQLRPAAGVALGSRMLRYLWTSEVRSVHLAAEGPVEAWVRHLNTPEVRRVRLDALLQRTIVARRSDDDPGIAVTFDGELSILPVLDRAHFPVEEPRRASA